MIEKEKKEYLEKFNEINADKSGNISKDELYCYDDFFMSPNQIKNKIKKPKEYLEQFNLDLFFDKENFTNWLDDPINNELNIKSQMLFLKEG